MRIKFYGVRGSIPTPMSEEQYTAKLSKILELHKSKTSMNIDDFLKSLPFELKGVYGGNTPCTLIEGDNNETLILDAGSGLRVLGNQLAGKSNMVYHIILSHFHWDHICGIPFFKPIYNPTNTVIFYAASNKVSYALNRQQHENHFPVSFRNLPAKRKVVILKENFGHKLGSFNIRPVKLNHPGGSHGFVILNENKKVSYLSDTEFTSENMIDKEMFYKACFESSDAVIMDTQYSLTESFSKFDWGHTSSSMAVNLALEWRVKKLITFHYDPEHDDFNLAKIGHDAIEQKKVFNKRNLEIIQAYEGLILEV